MVLTPPAVSLQRWGMQERLPVPSQVKAGVQRGQTCARGIPSGWMFPCLETHSTSFLEQPWEPSQLLWELPLLFRQVG